MQRFSFTTGVLLASIHLSESTLPQSSVLSSASQLPMSSPGFPAGRDAVRAKSGYTCRIRRKKCDQHQNEQGQCDTCVRLRLECLGSGERPDWLWDYGYQQSPKGNSSICPFSFPDFFLSVLSIHTIQYIYMWHPENSSHPLALLQTEQLVRELGAPQPPQREKTPPCREYF
ncbi:hypothetical protein R3P38DRAFT_1733545 [Favolaschia claudopus]|uniref:Zn(2)-C6 fungal-type domain-containing protein n=1 Tax=Favolaschia claudopus TaxID=2862362 RepID=A0AAW0A9R8_9AGAR